MGWDYQHVDKGTKTADIELPRFSPGWEVLDHAQVGSTFYVVARDVAEGPMFGTITAFVILVDRRSRDYFNYGHKDQTWDLGPTETKCPDRLLDLLPEPPNEWAEAWVRECRAYNRQVKTNRRVKPGQTVRLAAPLSFTDGVERDTFTYEGGSNFRSSDGVRVRITRWRERPFALVA
jgi:hypothetical protein